MRSYDDVNSPFWIDGNGVTQRTPMGKKLHFPRVALHAALRAFVYVRDSFTCQHCGTRPETVPDQYDGKGYIPVMRIAKSGYEVMLVIDHILSRRNGGTNHPSNLQALCECCNAAKSGLIDSKVGK